MSGEPSARKRAGIVLAALLAWAMLVLVMCPALLRHSSVDLPDDYLEYGVTDFAFFAEELRHGRLPSWNPYKHGGGSVFGDLSRMSSAYPVALLLLLLPLDLAVLLVWVGHLALGALGVQHLTRTLGAGRTGGMAGGIAWLFASPPVIAVVDGTLDNLPFLALCPWTLAAVARAASDLADPASGRRALRHAALAAVLLGLIGLGAHARFAAISFGSAALGGAAFWLLPPSGRRPNAPRWAALLGSVLVTGALLAMPAVWPTVREMTLVRAPPDGPPGSLVGQVLTWRGLAGLVYPRVLYLDERWHHLGAGILLCLVAPVRDRRGRSLLVASAVLVLLGTGSRGPLFVLERPLHWFLYPVEGAVAAQAVPFLAAAIGLGVDRVIGAEACVGVPAPGGGPLLPGGPARLAWIGAGLVGLAAVGTGWATSRAMYEPQIRSVPPVEGASLVHGGIAVCALAGLLALSRRFGPRPMAAGLLGLLLADGLAYAWRVQALLPASSVRPSSFVAAPPSLADVEGGEPPGRVLQWPLRPIRDFSGCLDGKTTDEGHGWGHAPWFDPLAVTRGEADLVLAGPLRRNAGSRTSVPQVDGRAKVPPMPWSVFAYWLSTAGPVDLGARRFLDPDPSDPRLAPRPGDRTAPGWAPVLPDPSGAGDAAQVRQPWAVMEGSSPRAGGCRDGPMGLGAGDEQSWLPRVLELLHVRWIVSPFPVDAFPGARNLEPLGDALSRFEVRDPRPPALLSPRVRRVATMPQAEDAAFGTAMDIRDEAIVVGGSPSGTSGRAGRWVAGRVRRWLPGSWDVDLPGSAGVLTVQDRYHPGWRARDEKGRRLEVLPANFVQLGVVVPEGTRRVVLRFVAPGAREGLPGGAAGLAILLLVLVTARAGRLRVAGGGPC